MEENFGLTWEDSAAVHTEEVICGIESEILQSDEYHGGEEVTVEEVVEEGEVVMTDHVTEEGEEQTVVEQNIGHDHDGMALSAHESIQQDDGTVEAAESIMYLTDNMLMMEHQQDAVAEEYVTTEEVEEEVVEHVVQEEVISGDWGEGCAEEIVVGSEGAVGTVDANQDECDIPLPTDQDEYTAARPYPCDFCSRRFRKKANLMNHMVAHQTDRPHGCNLCGVRYMRKNDLMNHLKIHAYIPEGTLLEEELDTIELDGDDDRKKRMKAQVVKKKKKGSKVRDDLENYGVASSSRSYNYVAEDMEQIGNNVQKEYPFLPEDQQEEARFPVLDPRKPFVCQHCGVGFAREKALYSHTRLHADGDSPFECQKCGEMFWDSGQMREHKKQKHGELEEYDDGDEDADYSEEDSKYGTFYCTTCGLSFHRQDNLRRHQRVHVKEEYGNEAEYAHVCNVCGESFTEALDLLAHAEVHARSTEHRCMVCGEVLPDETSLAVHVQAKHGKNLPPNTCMLCGRACKDRRTLLKHSWEHSTEKVFNCPKCAKTFHNKARLKRHMLSHRNKVVSCEVCGEEFPDGRSLMNHRHSHSSVSGRQFPCRECGKTFGSRSSQQIHIRIHTGERPYGCRFCWKAFADGGTLRKHERIHTGEKPYACAVCPRAFNQRVVLREHIRSHHSGPDPKYSNSMTPYCCAVCSDMFATSQDLILHLIHHCDMNTAMKRQPQLGPRKYKRRRKLKPHELELISGRVEGDDNDNNLETIEDQYNHMEGSEEEPERIRRRYSGKRQPRQKTSGSSPGDGEMDHAQHQQEQDFIMFDEHDAAATQAAVESLTNPTPNIATKQTPTKNKQKKFKGDQNLPSRPKMIHTQKTRVPVETCEDGRIRHRTKTLVTRTQPTEIKTSTGDRIRPRTKNVSYHVLQPEKLPLATFPDLDSDTQQAVDSILKEESVGANETIYDTQQHTNGIVYMDTLDQPPGVAAEQTVETEVISDIIESRRIRTRSSSSNNGNNASLKSGRHVIGPGSKVRLIKEGMIVSKARTPRKSEETEPESILPYVPHTNNAVVVKGNESPIPDIENEEESPSVLIKQEIIIQPEMVNVKQEMFDPSPSPLHELAEISMQHASANACSTNASAAPAENSTASTDTADSAGLFRCEMCSEVFNDRAQLLVHVPVHI